MSLWRDFRSEWNTMVYDLMVRLDLVEPVERLVRRLGRLLTRGDS
jgi:hypothetical protein